MSLTILLRGRVIVLMFRAALILLIHGVRFARSDSWPSVSATISTSIADVSAGYFPRLQ